MKFVFIIIFIYKVQNKNNIFYVSENQTKIDRQLEKINAIPLVDSWLIKYQQNLYSESSSSETNIQKVQLNHHYTNLPSLMPMVDVDQLKTIKLNTWL